MTNTDTTSQSLPAVEVQTSSRGDQTTLIRAEQARLLYEQVGASLFTSLANACLVTYVLWTIMPSGLLLGWLGMVVAIATGRFVLLQTYRRIHGQHSGEYWIRLFAIGAGGAGLVWGMAGLLLTPQLDFPHQLFLAFVLGGMALGGIPYLSIVPYVYRAFLFTTIIPLCAVLIAQFDSLHLVMGLMGLLFMVMMLVTSRRLYRSLYDALVLRFDYKDLIRDISQVKSRLLLTNIELQNEVAERKHTELVLRESEERTRRLAEAAFEGLIMHEHGKVVDANQTFAEMIGYSVDELIGSSVLRLVATSEHERVVQSIMQRPQGNFEVLAQHRDGHVFPVELRGRDMPMGDKHVRVVAVRNLTEQKAAEARVLRSERKLSSILNNVQDTLYQSDSDNMLIWMSPSVRTLLGFTAEELSGRAHGELFAHTEALTELLRELERNRGSVSGYETRFRHKDGSQIWVSLNAHYYPDSQGGHAGIECAARDISALKSAELALFAEKERVQVTLESIGDGVIATDVRGQINFMNPMAEKLTGWDKQAAQGLILQESLWLVDEESGRRIEDPVRACLESDSSICLSGQTLLVDRTGEQRYSIEVTASPLRDREGHVIGAVLVLHDVSALRGLALQMSYQASHDSLTQLINRREFENRVEQGLESARRDNTEHALCFMDLDQFKVVNDTCGHIAGDELLKQLAKRLQTTVRDTDALARLGGDEFGVLLLGCPLARGREIAESLRNTIRDYRFVWEDKVFEIGVSIGVVGVTAESGSLYDVLSAADLACYVAKDHGRNRIHVLDGIDMAAAQEQGHMQWLQRIQRALEEDRFELYFQPIRALSQGGYARLHGEVLLRMLDAQGQVVPPDDFIPAAERYKLMSGIDRWVVHHAIELIKGCHAALVPGQALCAINLSGQSLCDADFLSFVIAELDSSDVPPQCLCFEITETAAIANFMHAVRFIEVLRGMGCRFALDDFGSGVSSFSYLKKLPVDFLKIDGSFVKGVIDDDIDAAMVASINQIGHIMGMQTVAEFVENEDIETRMADLGVDFVQGYGVGRPEPFPVYCQRLLQRDI